MERTNTGGVKIHMSVNGHVRKQGKYGPGQLVRTMQQKRRVEGGEVTA